MSAPPEGGKGADEGGKKKGKKGDSKPEETDEAAKAAKKNKYRRDKPWDTDDIDHWKPVAITEADVPSSGLLLEESSFATLFPAYREQYLKTVWPDVKKALGEHNIGADLNLVEGSMSVKTTRKTFDPYMIIKARDMVKLLARSVPLPQAQKVLEDDVYCDILKIGGLVHSKEKFVKRRQRLVGPNGSTLKAIELLTNCFVMVQGQTVCCMGGIKGMKQVRRIVEDCFKNIHPIYQIKELMIRRELEKDPDLKDENWERFLPNFKKQNVQRKKQKFTKKKSKDVFPPQPTPRKEDLQMETGEYFLNEQERETKKRVERRVEQKAKSMEKKRERAKEFEAPAAKAKVTKKPREESGESAKVMAERIAGRATTKAPKKQKTGADLLL